MPTTTTITQNSQPPHMLKNLEAADILGADEDDIFKEFREIQKQNMKKYLACVAL